MIDFTKEEALLAAEQFCYAIEVWTRQFVENRTVAESLEVEFLEGTLHQYDEKTKARLQDSLFYELIDVLYEFAVEGKWGGKTEFSSQEMISVKSDVTEYFTEICRFDEVFTKDKSAEAHLIFMGLSHTESYMDVSVNGKWILDILTSFTRMMLARWRLIEPFAGAITLEDLALLSGLNLKTVRNAISSKGGDKLVADQDGFVGHQEAVRWLKRKKGFSGPFCLNEDIHYSSYDSIGQIANHCESLLIKQEKTAKDMLSDLQLNDAETRAVKALIKASETEALKALSPSLLKQIGEYLKVTELEVFVVEGSKVISISVATLEASRLF